MDDGTFRRPLSGCPFHCYQAPSPQAFRRGPALGETWATAACGTEQGHGTIAMRGPPIAKRDKPAVAFRKCPRCSCSFTGLRGSKRSRTHVVRSDLAPCVLAEHPRKTPWKCFPMALDGFDDTPQRGSSLGNQFKLPKCPTKCQFRCQTNALGMPQLILTHCHCQNPPRPQYTMTK